MRPAEYGFGHVPDEPWPWSAPAGHLTDLEGVPQRLLYEDSVVEVLSQKRTSTCTTHTTAQIIRMSQKLWFPERFAVEPPPLTSILLPYYDGRTNPQIDAGAQPRLIFEAYREYGYAIEEAWPFKPERVNEKPPTHARVASYDQIGALEYFRCADAGGNVRKMQILAGFMQCRFCAVSIPVNDAFLDYEGGVWNFEGSPIGTPRHYVAGVGYDADLGLRIVNSWGAWGDRDARGRPGFAWIGWDTILDRKITLDVYVITVAPVPTG